MVQVFISYSRVDTAFVELFIRRLQLAFPDLKIWHDQAPHGLIGGDNWWSAILSAIAASDVFIYILSNESVNSLYCQAEFTEARRLQKRIITVQARDKTELTDDLDDIQFINMKNGVDDADAFARLVAAVNLRLREAQKYRNARPLWKPATPKPNKEAPPSRTADSPDITTPALGRPSLEIEALRFAKESERRQTRIALLGIGVALFAALIGLIPWLTERSENASATQAALALTPSSTATMTLTPTPTDTLDVAMIVASLDAQATLDQATANVQATAAARLTEYAAGTQNASDQTATATLWTSTPTPNITASIEAFRTQQAQTATQAWIDSWTPTPTPTPTPTSDPLEAALTAARNFTGSNADWQALYPDGFVHSFEDGVPMVLVPAGCFMMGSDAGYDDERPVHQQCFAEPFWIDKYEVTQADFERLGGAATTASYFTGDQRPVERITWFEARDFCARRGARLPTEAEWEYAARGPDALVYPWGNSWNENNAVWGGNSNGQTANVGSRPAGASWVGALDMSGNVWEWTSSLYEPYPYLNDGSRERDTGNSTDVRRVVRGGSWVNGFTVVLRAGNRNWVNPDYGGYFIGFRCVRSR